MKEELTPRKIFPRESPENPSTTLAQMARGANLLFRIETQGADFLRKIPEGKHVIFLTSHFSDYDMPIAIAALADTWGKNLKVMQASTNERFGNTLGAKIARTIEGADDALAVSFRGKPGEQGRSGVFNPDDYALMRKSLEEGSSLVAAAYFDPTYQNKEWHLPARGGYGGVYLAQITPETVIVPIAVDIQSEKPLGMGDKGIMQIIKEVRPRVAVRIGCPLEPQKIEGIERFKEILKRREHRESITDAEHAEFTRMRRALREESDRVMQNLSDMLPPKKRAVTIDTLGG